MYKYFPLLSLRQISYVLSLPRRNKVLVTRSSSQLSNAFLYWFSLPPSRVTLFAFIVVPWDPIAKNLLNAAFISASV